MPTLVIARECERCGGKMELKRDHYGEYWDCLRCGNHLDLGKPLPYAPGMEKKRKENW